MRPQIGSAIPAPGAGARYGFLVETVLGLALILVVNFLLFAGDPGFLRVNPHPFWVVVLLIASRYGFRAGFFAGLLSGVGYLLFKAASIPDVSWIDLRQFDVWGRPLLFWCAGMVLGEIAEGHLLRRRELREHANELEQQLESEKQRYEALSQAKEEMDTRIFSQEETLSTMFEAAQALRSLEEADIYPAIVNLAHDYLEAGDCVLYLVESDGFRPMASFHENDGRVDAFPGRNHPLLGLALRERRTVTVREFLGVELPEDAPLICVPILTGEGGDVLGILSIETLPFQRFNPNSIRVAGLLADWCASSLHNALLHKSTRERLIEDDLANAYNFKYFHRRLREEFLRARRYGLALSLIYIELPEFVVRSTEEQQSMRVAMSSVLGSQIRSIDLVFLDEKPGALYLMLPTTPMAGARVVARNIMRAFYALNIMAYEDERDFITMLVGVAGFDDEMKDPEEMVSMALEDREHAASAL